METEASGSAAPRQDFRPGPPFFSAPPRLAGEESVSLDLAGIGVRFESLGGEMAALLRARFAGFLGTRADEVRVRAASAPVPCFLRRVRAGESYRLETERQGEALLVWSYGFAARYLHARRECDLRLAPEDGPARALSLENVVRLLVSWRALEEGELLLHAAGVERGGRAFVFFGPSGAGKTTACRLSEGRGRVLNDDTLLLRRGAAGWEAAPLPLTGAYRLQAAPGFLPVAALCRLVQAPEPAVERLSAALAVGEVVSCVPFFEDRPMDRALLDVVGRLVREVPVGRLRFRRDPSFWEVLERWI